MKDGRNKKRANRTTNCPKGRTMCHDREPTNTKTDLI